MTIKFRGVRGAITVDENAADAILDATEELLQKMIEANEIVEDDVASVILSTTPDLNAVYPAGAVRRYGWRRTALLGCQEMDMPGGLPRCIRILIHWSTTKSLDEIQHIFLRDATTLRPDLFSEEELSSNGRSSP